MLYIVADDIAAKTAAKNIAELSGEQCVIIPSKNEVLVHTRAASRENIFSRLSALYYLTLNKAKFAVVTVQSLMQIAPHYESFKKSIKTFKKGENYNLLKTVQELVSLGYVREERAAEPGQFCLHGDILDIFSIQNDYPYRLEFFGDEIEAIKTIDLFKYTSFDDVKSVDICPAKEFFCNDKLKAEEMIKNELSTLRLSPDSFNLIKDKVFELLEILNLNDSDFSLSYLLPFANFSFLKDYLPKESVIIFDEPKLLEETKDLLFKEHRSRFESLLSTGHVLPSHFNQYEPFDNIFDFKDAALVSFNIFPSSNGIFAPKDIIDFKAVSAPNYQGILDNVIKDFKNWKELGYKVLIMGKTADPLIAAIKNMQEVQVFQKVLDNFFGIAFLESMLENGYIYHDEKLVVLGNFDISKKRKEKLKHKSSINVFSDLSVGDYVVHETHGIGAFRGMSVLKGNLGQKEYLTIEFKDADKLYVPCDQIDVLSKYSGGDKIPNLSKIGGREFAVLKERARKSLKELAINLKSLYAEREEKIGFKFSKDNAIQKDFEESFEFEETTDQLKCVSEIKNDMESEKVMDRLLCGDVGYGKTEVALRAALKAVLSEKQVAILSPTTILSQQHYNVIQKRFENIPIRTAVLNRFKKSGEQKEILNALKDGKIDIISGTHRLLSNDIVFENLGLLIVDEEQRFGVAHKEKIKLLKKNVDVLTMTATPIPRTLHMSLTGIRDISTIETPPQGRIPPQTYVLEYSDELIKDAVLKEIGRDGQVFMLYNKVESIEGFAAKINRLVPTAKIAVAHGLMQEHKLEDIILKFYNNEFNVLICTTIIENGIDIPNANTLIVYEADKLGLSQLYQLKGRVGRSTKISYVYFTFLKDKILAQTAYKRLQAITEFTEFGSGFKIAMRDLEIRGAGSLLGAMQSGHIEKVGYDMYVKILKEESNKLKGIKEPMRVNLDVDIDAYIPENYIDNEDERIRVYQELNLISNELEADEMYRALSDIYGAVPYQLNNLIDISRIKFWASNIGVCDIVIKKNENFILFFGIEDLNNDRIVEALNNMKAECVLTFTDKPKILFNVQKNQKIILKTIYDFLKYAQNNLPID